MFVNTFFASAFFLSTHLCKIIIKIDFNDYPEGFGFVILGDYYMNKIIRVRFIRLSCICFLILCGCFFCFKTSETAEAKSAPALSLTYDDEVHNYKGVQGKLFYGHKETALLTLPVIKLKKTLYVPAGEVLETVLGYTYTFDPATGIYKAEDPDLSLSISFQAGEYGFTVVHGGKTKEISGSRPNMMIGVNGAEAILCVPANKLFSALGMQTQWDKKACLYSIQRDKYFDWSVEEPAEEESVNHIYRASGNYKMADNMASLHLHFYGNRQASFDKAKVNRDEKLITVTLPESVFLPTATSYGRFAEIAESMTVSAADNTVTITVNCFDVTEFTYTTSEETLHLQLLWDYSAGSGEETKYDMTIKRPDVNCLIDQVSVVDLYDSVSFQKAFQIVIKGDHTKFFKENPVIINNNTVKKVKISLSSKKETVIRVTTKSLQACKVYRQGDNFGVVIRPPKKLFKNIVVLDAGHGDYDNGCTQYGYCEKDLNLKMIYTNIRKYFEKPDGDTKIYWTRRTDKFVTLDDRARFAAKVKADIFISLHMNWATNKQANGTEVYYSTDNNKASFSGFRSSIMAEMMDSTLVETLNNDDRGVRTAGFYVIKHNTVPAILIELGFLSGNKDHKKLTDSDYQKEASKTIAEVINRIFEEHPTGR